MSYDIFISFKNSVNNQPTKDKEIAKCLYELLRKKKNVFFSNKTLYEEGTSEYMFKIQNALTTSNTLIIVCSNVDYIETGWVAQEWLTFLNMSLTSPDRKIYTLLHNVDSSILPAFLRIYQSFNNPEEASSYVLNSFRNTTKDVASVSISDFINCYFGLSGVKDIKYAMTTHIPTESQNDPLVQWMKIKYELLQNLADSTIDTLNQLILQDNTLAHYELSMLYKNFKYEYFDIHKSETIAEKAFLIVKDREVFSDVNYDYNFLIWYDNEEYNSGFLTAELMSRILDHYGIKVRIVLHKNGSTITQAYNNMQYVFISDVIVNQDIVFVDWLSERYDKTIIVLNSFANRGLPLNLHRFHFYNSNDDGLRVMLKRILSEKMLNYE